MALAPVEPGGELALVHHRGRHAVGRLVGPVGDDLDQALVAPPVRGSRGKAGDAGGNKTNGLVRDSRLTFEVLLLLYVGVCAGKLRSAPTSEDFADENKITHA